MDLARLQKNWDNLGKTDPLWAILTEPGVKGGKWDLEAFLRTGVDFVGWLEQHVRGLGLAPGRARALDFGCGYGRLTQALATRFDEAVGVDIAPAMIEGAERTNRQGARCRFVLNAAPDLRQFPDASFDFVLSILVLQHMRPDYAASYIAEFMRVLRPGGVAFFQVPAAPVAFVSGRARRRKPAPQRHRETALRWSLAAHPGSIAFHADEWRWFRVRLVHCGNRRWKTGPGPGRIRLAARWYRLDDTVLRPAAGVDLPGDVAPGEQVEILVPVRAPPETGHFVLKFQGVEGDEWCETMDRPAARVVVHVAPGGDGAAAGPPPLSPVLQEVPAGPETADEREIMVYALPAERVLATVHAAGGEIVEVGEDGWAGVEMISAHYTVRR